MEDLEYNIGERRRKNMDLIGRLAEEFKIKEKYLNNLVELLDEGNTIPFIARYRKRADWGNGGQDHQGHLQ